MRLVKICNRFVEYGFYLLFLSVPLFFAPDTSELFEFNKLWLTFAFTIIIAAAWLIKMIATRRFKIQRTPLDIPIGLFLLSQIISTIISIDPHTSIWGYYSRFNGGLLSIIAYIFLYYAFVSNLYEIKYVKRILRLSLVSGFLVALWGTPSHFGYDPTCLAFRGTFDVSCWTADFQPKVRIFSTLGQPDWLAAYLAILIPISLAFSVESAKKKIAENKVVKGIGGFLKTFWVSLMYLVLALLFYLDLLYANSRSGAIGAWASLIIFAGIYLWIEWKSFKKIGVKKFAKKQWFFLVPVFAVIIITFMAGKPLGLLGHFTYVDLSGKISSLFAPKQTATTKNAAPKTIQQPAPLAHITEFGGTDSSKIRAIVWQGAIKIWENYPLFGSGVETFAFSYYKYRPAAHNLTSEWNFLYNKAHNEYLNYLATTGAFGLLTYLAIIFLFLWIIFSKVLKKFKIPEFEENTLLILGISAGYISILITNFFGFSVVVVNTYFFIFPVFALILAGFNFEKTYGFEIAKKAPEVKAKSFKIAKQEKLSAWGWILSLAVFIAAVYMLSFLYTSRKADISYAYGHNLDQVQQYQQAYSYLHTAIALRPGEPVFQDELAFNDAVVAVMLLSQNQQQQPSSQAASLAQKLAQEAVTVGTKVVTDNPNNIVFWKTQTRIFYTLAQVDPRYLPLALEAIKKAAVLAPSDANISYNLGILYGQTGNLDQGVVVLNNTIKLKPDYRDAYYALGIFYHQLSVDKTGKIVKPEDNKKAIEQMQHILTFISSTDSMAKEAIKTWSK